MFDIVGRRYLYFLISLLVIVPGVVSLLIFGLRVGIDFTGGTYWEVVPKNTSTDISNDVAKLLKTQGGHPEALVQNATLMVNNVTTPTLIMRMANVSTDEKDQLNVLLIENNVVSGTV